VDQAAEEVAVAHARRQRRRRDRCRAVRRHKPEGAVRAPRRRISEFARDRSARIIVVGSRRRKLGQSVSTSVMRTGERPVIVARSIPRLTAAA
jgi:nucleotide-binding universal stress UspA family protein